MGRFVKIAGILIDDKFKYGCYVMIDDNLGYPGGFRFSQFTMRDLSQLTPNQLIHAAGHAILTSYLALSCNNPRAFSHLEKNRLTVERTNKVMVHLYRTLGWIEESL